MAAQRSTEDSYQPPVLNEEQVTRKDHLLSSFRYFAAAWQGGYYHPQPHDEMCDQLEECAPNPEDPTQRKKVYLTPRFTYKTALLVCFMAYLIVKWREAGRDIAIDYIRSDYELAAEVLYELKQSLQIQPFVLELWGDLSKLANLWSEGKINLGNRRDPTVNVSGLNRGTAGKHPDIVIADDMVNEKNFESPKAKKSARYKIQAYSPVLPPWGSMIVVGTRFAHNDVYGWILEKNEKDSRRQKELMAEAIAIFNNKERAAKLREAEAVRPQWTTYIRSVRNSSGEMFFPDVLTEEFLNQQKQSIEAKFYAAWYENRPDIEGMVRFRLEYLKYFTAHYNRWPVPSLTVVGDSGNTIAEFPVRVTMTIDPTVTANAHSDWTGVTVNATDSEDNWWILMSHRYLEVPSIIGEKMVEIIRRYHPEVVVIESAQADVDMVKRIQTAISEEHIRTSIRSYHPLRDETHNSGRRKKSARIEAMEPRFRSGKIFLHRGTCEALYDQYRQWPDVENDDVFDSLAMQYGVAKPCAYKAVDEALEDYLDEDDTEEPGDLFRAYRMGEEPGRIIGRAGLASQRLAAHP